MLTGKNLMQERRKHNRFRAEISIKGYISGGPNYLHKITGNIVDISHGGIKIKLDRYIKQYICRQTLAVFADICGQKICLSGNIVWQDGLLVGVEFENVQGYADMKKAIEFYCGA
jgi:hypothetical protein